MPKKIVNKMLDIPEIKTACENLTATFLEPAAGEGVFLVEILMRKLKMVSDKYNNDLNQFENYSLLALTTLRSEEHTSELQSRFDLVCRLLLEKKKQK